MSIDATFAEPTADEITTVFDEGVFHDWHLVSNDEVRGILKGMAKVTGTSAAGIAMGIEIGMRVMQSRQHAESEEHQARFLRSMDGQQ